MPVQRRRKYNDTFPRGAAGESASEAAGLAQRAERIAGTAEKGAQIAEERRETQMQKMRDETAKRAADA